MGKQTKITDYKTSRIKKYTGGKLETHDLGDGKLSEGSQLKNSFLSKGGGYIGDYGRAWWYFKNNLVVCEEFPHTVAIVLKDRADKIPNFNPENISPENIKGYYGYSHRGGNTFVIGDRLFDQNYTPTKEDYNEEWDAWEVKFKEALENADEFDKKNIQESGIQYIIPFRFRGRKVIENLSEAKQAAKNMGDYLS